MLSSWRRWPCSVAALCWERSPSQLLIASLTASRDTGRAMSRENVELVRAVYEGWARGDFRAGSDLLAPSFEWKQRPDAVEPGSHHGAAIGTALRHILDVWEGYRIEAEEYIDAADAVVVVGRARGTARASGIP